MIRSVIDTPDYPHGTRRGYDLGCGCEDCYTVRRKSRIDSTNKFRQQVKNGTYKGAHGKTCQKYGCTCEAAQPFWELVRTKNRDRRRAKRESERAKRQEENGVSTYKFSLDRGAVTIMHYPPRGTGMWKCSDCGLSFPYRPVKDGPVAEQQAS